MKILENEKVQIIISIALIGLIIYLLYRFEFFTTKEDKTAEALGDKGGALDTSAMVTTQTVKDLKKKYGSTKLNLSTNKYPDYAKRIWDAKGVFYDDPENVNSVFRELKNRADVKVFASYFKVYYKNTGKVDLFEYLKTFLNSDELTDISKIINVKPAV